MDLSACAAEINKAALEAEARASQIETTLSADRIATGRVTVRSLGLLRCFARCLVAHATLVPWSCRQTRDRCPS